VEERRIASEKEYDDDEGERERETLRTDGEKFALQQEFLTNNLPDFLLILSF